LIQKGHLENFKVALWDKDAPSCSCA